MATTPKKVASKVANTAEKAVDFVTSAQVEKIAHTILDYLPLGAAERVAASRVLTGILAGLDAVEEALEGKDREAAEKAAGSE